MKRLLIVIAIIIAILLALCVPDLTKNAESTARYPSDVSQLDNESECPHDWDWSDAVKPSVEAITGGRDNIPEYNDCQRLLLGNLDTPIFTTDAFAIFASGGLGRQTDGTAALIKAGGRYEPLGIGPGWNCLVATMEASGEWSAVMVPVGQDLERCTGEVDPSEGTSLRVAVDSRYGGDAVPPVVRWGFDSIEWEHFIVSRCGDRPCYIGLSEVPQVIVVGASLRGGQVYEVAGWNDRQYLAQRPAAGGPVEAPVQPALEAWLVPDPELGQKRKNDYLNKWVKVAEVRLDAHSDEYVAKANFGHTPAGSKPTEIYNCIDGFEDAPAPLAPSGRCPGMDSKIMDAKCANLDAKTGDKYRSMHVRTLRDGLAADTLFRCVEFFPLEKADSLLTIPGTVRWRWLTTDETLWHRCDSGCCKVD